MQPDAATIDDWRWLTSDEAQARLNEVLDRQAGVTLVRSLRKSLGAARASLVLGQVELRRRAFRKFAEADRMLFTRQLLEQATDERIASCKARRFSGAAADLCCGIGGDLMSLATWGPALGIDRDPVACLLADWNCRVTGRTNVRTICQNAADVDLRGVDAWHADPDRRAAGPRTSQPAWSDPAPELLKRLLADCPNAAIKLAPAAGNLPDWAADAERQWIGSRNECRQQVLWLGNLARHPGHRTAVIAEHPDRVLVETPQARVAPCATNPLRYLLEPHAAVLAASLQSSLGVENSLPPITADGTWWTSDTRPADPLLSCFEVRDVLPFRLTRLRAIIRERGIGRLEIKQRGGNATPEQLRAKLKPKGDRSATLIVLRMGGRVAAVLADRCG